MVISINLFIQGWYFCTVGQHGYAAMKDCHLFHPDTSCDIAPEKGWKYSVVSKNGILWVPDPNIRVVPQNPPSEGKKDLFHTEWQKEGTAVPHGRRQLSIYVKGFDF